MIRKLEEVVNKDTDKEAQVPASVFIIADCWSTDYVLPRLRTKFNEHAFSHAGPSAWNMKNEDIPAESNITNFRKLLKTHYFNFVFNVQ